jgi:nucleotide-binding universal stress UspA family protein
MTTLYEKGGPMPEIVVGIDDSAGAQDALAFATRIATSTGASLRLASAFPYDDMPSRASNGAYRQFLRADAQALLDRAVAATDAAVSATEAIADHSPPHALHELTERIDAALVVVGSTRRGPVGRILPGSTGERLLHDSPCPVTIVPRGYVGGGPIRIVGVWCDGSTESAAALAAACQLARRFGAAVRVIRVFDAGHVGAPALMTIPGYVGSDAARETRMREGLQEAVAELPADVRPEPVFVIGSVGRELVAQSALVDLLLVGSRGYHPRTAVLLGGATHMLLRKAACPVIVLPRGSRGLEALFAPAAETAATPAAEFAAS